ncbi:MAG: hypothetical protein LBH42_03315 [Treponema sp.]|jgi:hypothetical protein|nr:hypothetical protein [Treponema sp.]
MTEKKYRETICKYDGKITESGSVNFPKTLRIKTKSEALDLLDILIHDEHSDLIYMISPDEPLMALRKAIQKGLL